MRKKKMTEDVLMTVLSEKAAVSRDDTEKVMTALKEFISTGINESEERKLFVPGFGTFSRRSHKGHPLNLHIQGVGPRIDDYEVVKFKADPAFRDAVLR